jgi:hypothetical protein
MNSKLKKKKRNGIRETKGPEKFYSKHKKKWLCLSKHKPDIHSGSLCAIRKCQNLVMSGGTCSICSLLL